MADTQELFRRIEVHGLSRLVEHVRTLLDDDPGHDFHHVLRVASWTVELLAETRGQTIGADLFRCAVAAALLHDVVNLPKNSPDRAIASELSAQRARELLPSFGFDSEQIEAVADAIRDHSFSRGAVPQSDLGKALQDADRLEALGALGLMRTFSTGARMGSKYFDPNDPWSDRRPHDDLAYSIDHFFTKLLALPDTMLTAAGRAEAHRRGRFLSEFLRQLGTELGRPYHPSGR